HTIDAIEDYTGNLSLEFVDYRLDKHPNIPLKNVKSVTQRMLRRFMSLRAC
ncbi:hypothetical protein LEA_10236, partial [human gut metagenome]